ncbi:MAG: spondin domain-containing protein [Pseudomonadota bacterium]
MTELRITIRNTSETGGTFLTPFYFGFHDGAFDLFDVGEAASPGLEQLAEDGMFGIVAGERLAASPDSQGVVVMGENGPIATQEVTSSRVHIDSSVNTEVSFAAMILPSNDAFVGTDDALVLFDEYGRFLGAQTVVFEGDDVYDAGTEVNTELDAAFINQTGPNTGEDENGVIRQHPGFNGSEGNPDGEGDQIILGGTNAFGAEITEEADFTRDGAQIAVVHINEVVETNLGGRNDRFNGGSEDDIVFAGGGRDRIDGGRGWDEIYGERGDDRLEGGRGDDQLFGGRGDDRLDGGRDNDLLFGGRGDDRIDGGRGNDVIAGGKGDDDLRGDGGADTFVFGEGDGDDDIRDFGRGNDRILLSIDVIEDFSDVLAVATETRRGVELDFDGGDSLFLRRVDIDDLSAEDFLFA